MKTLIKRTLSFLRPCLVRTFNKNEKGISLVEVMIATGIMGALSLAVAQMMKTQKQVMTHSEAKAEEIEIYAQIRTVLSNKKACDHTFKGKKPDDKITEIQNSKGNVVYQVRDEPYGNRAIQLNNLTLKDKGGIPAGGGQGEAILLVETTRLKKTTGQKKMTREIMLQVNTDENKKIIECYSATDSIIETAKEEMCEAISGVYDSSTGLCDLNCISTPGESNEPVSSECLDGIRSDERQISEDSYVNIVGDTMSGDLNIEANLTAEKLCVGPNCRDFTEQACSPGDVVTKIRADGSLECVSMDSAANCGARKHMEVWSVLQPKLGNRWFYQCRNGKAVKIN